MGAMRDDAMARAAMEEELGNRRQDTLPLDDRESHNRPAYQPSRARVVQNADSKRVSNKWKDRINAGAFNDSDAAAVRDLADLGGPRTYDRNARRLSVRPPPPSQITTRSSTPSTIMGQASRPVVCLPPHHLSMGMGSRPGATLPSTSSTPKPPASQQVASDTKAQVGTGGDRLAVPAPPHSGRVNAPPTPAASPTAPTPGVSTAKPATAGSPAVTPVSQPKPGRGLQASRWAADGGQSAPATNSHIQEPDKVSFIEPKVVERQATPQSCSSDAQVRETTQALSKLKISEDEKKVKVSDDVIKAKASDNDMKAKVSDNDVKARVSDNDVKAQTETKAVTPCIDPMTGESLGQEFVISKKARLLVNTPDGKRRCGLYLRVGGPTSSIFDMVIPGEPKVTHNLLDMLSQSQGGAFLDLAFRLPDNGTVRYSFEFGTQKEASDLLLDVDDLRDLTVWELSKELVGLAKVSSDEIGNKLNVESGYARPKINIATVAYPFPAPIRKTCSVRSEAKRTDIDQGVLIPEVDDASSKSQRRTYTQKELKSLRTEESNVPLFQIDDNFIRAVRRSDHKRTDSEECVVGVTTEKNSPSADVASPTAVLCRLRQMMSDDRSWVSRRGEKAP